MVALFRYRKIWGRHVLNQKIKLSSRNVGMLFGSTMVRQLVLSEVGVVAAGYGAVVGLIPCMSPHVVISVADHRKSFGAEFA